MIKVLQHGGYELMETKHQIKILYLDDLAFVWIDADKIGEILVATHTPHQSDQILAIGRYWLYDVDGEPRFADRQHLELLVGDGVWQGYILPTGLPSDTKTRSRIIPTSEIISIANRSR